MRLLTQGPLPPWEATSSWCTATLCMARPLCPLQVQLDGHDIQKLNLHWLRDRLALVSQEPILFNLTILGAFSG